MEIKIGEYTIIEDLKNGVFECLRHGQEWRGLIGDNMVLALVSKIQEQQEFIKDIAEHRIEDFEDFHPTIDVWSRKAKKLLI
jgi:hypothetical protein